MGTVKEIMSIGDVVFETIFGILNAMISTLTGGLVTEWLGGDATVEDMTEQLLENLRERTIELIEEAGVAITNATVDLTNAIARNFMDVLGITDVQMAIAERLRLEMEARIALLEREAELIETEEAAAARTLAERTMEVLADRAQMYEDQYGLFMARLIEEGEKEEVMTLETSLAGLEMAQRMLDIDVSMIHDLAEERNVEAVVGMITEIEETLKASEDWALETAIKPLAYGEMGLNVLAHFLERTPEEIKEELKAYVEASYKLTGELIPTFTPKPGGE